MTRHPVTYADLDQLLRGYNFDSRPVPPDHVAYVDRSQEPIFVFPSLPPNEAVWPHHLAAVRHRLVETGLAGQDEYDRWLCAMRFGDLCREPETAGATDGRVAR
jgi:hypothetical protein